jgi:L-iditol 2-dehydrogenase
MEGGRRVGVFPLIPCFNCASCQEKHFETCENYSYIGSRQDGAFAEYVAVPEWNLFTLPDSVSFEQAALLEPAAVALHAMNRLDLSAVQSVAVIGNGVIGQIIAKWLEIYGVANAALLGRHDTPKLGQYDACFEAVGSAEAFRRCLDIVRPNGQIVLVGNPNVDFNIDQKLYWQILRKQIIVRGSWNSSYPNDWQKVLEYADKLQLDRFISHRFELGRFDAATNMMYNKTEKYGKVVLQSRQQRSQLFRFFLHIGILLFFTLSCYLHSY